MGSSPAAPGILRTISPPSARAPEPSPSPFVTRFAPSPTGRPHLGHAFSALSAWTAAREAGGRFLLRIEDIDSTRCRPQFEAAFLEDLAWLGLDWERPVRRQSEHLAEYRAALDRLRRAGLLYRCFRTRAEVMADIGRAPHGEGAAGAWRGGPEAPEVEAALMAQGRPFAWRLSLEAALGVLGDTALTFEERGQGPLGEHGRIRADPAAAGDVVLARKDLGVAYHLAVVVDDALQGVTDVIRGADLFEAAHVQRLLQALLGAPATRYRHHRLVTGPDGRRLAKRDKAQTLADLRASGVGAAEVRAQLGFA